MNEVDSVLAHGRLHDCMRELAHEGVHDCMNEADSNSSPVSGIHHWRVFSS